MRPILHAFQLRKPAAWPLFAAAVILVAAAITLVRLWLPGVDRYRADIESWASGYVGLPVTLGEIQIQWRRLHPQLVIHNACVSKKEGEHSVACIKEAHLALDVWATLWQGAPGIGDLTVVGASLSVLRRIDGGFAIIGLEDMPSDPRMQALLQRWLMAQDYLVIKDSQLRWRDERSGRERHFTHLNLDLRNTGSRHQLSGTVAITANADSRAKVVFDLQGDVFTANDWSGRGYIEGVAIDLARWLEGREVAGIVAGAGSANFKVWGTWQNAHLQFMQGEANFSELQLQGQGDASLVAQTLAGHFSWQRHAQGWRLDADRIALVLANNHPKGLPAPADTRLKVAVTQEGAASVFEVGVNGLHLQDGAALLMLSNVFDDVAREAWAGMRPDAELGNVYVRYRNDETAAQRSVMVRARFDDLMVSRWKDFPGITGLDGVLRMDDRSGVLILDSQAAQFDFGGLFRAPLTIDTLTGRVAWRHQQGAWRIQTHGLSVANAHIGGSVNAVIDIPEDGASPFVNLVADFANGNAEYTSRYLPVSIMPENTVHWLDNSIISGRVTNGQALFHGRVNDFPFTGGAGRFEVRFDVADGILDYAPGWPRLEEIETEVVFSDSSMEINAVAGKSLASEISQVHVAIENLGGSPPVLEIQGKAHGPTADALRYVRESPLNKKIGKYLGDARAQGRSTLDLELTMPLAATATDRIKGALGFDDSSLAFAESGVELTQVNGVLNFTEVALAARNIRANLFGQAAGIDITTQAAQHNAFRFEARGSANANTLAQQFNVPILKHFSGDSDWLATLRVVDTENGEASAALHVESTLKGMAIKLPAPLHKPASQASLLILDASFPRAHDSREGGGRIASGTAIEGAPLNIRYGDIFKGAFTLTKDGTVERGELRFGPGNASLPGTPGWRIAGEMPQFSVTEWMDFIEAEPPQDTATATAPQVTEVDVRIADLELFGQHLNDVQMQAKNTAQEWNVIVASARVAGRLRVPHREAAPITADFEHLEWMKMENKGGAIRERGADPRLIPPLRVTSKRFMYDGIDLGSLNAVTSQRPAGLHLDSLQLASDATQISAQGDWLVDKGTASSSFTAVVNSTNLGKTFRQFGFADTFAEGEGRSDLVARWPGAPHTFTLAQLDGELLMNFKKGRLLDVEPGAGRLFGLMALNFKGLFTKGFSFNRIEGGFVINKGNAYTSNLIMEGPSAHVTVQGRVGLAAKDYDQRVTVTPRSSTALPLAGVLTGGMGVGAAVLLFQKLFQSELDRITRYQYTVKGAWDNPEFDLSSKEKAPNASPASPPAERR